jgi:hypothetical protein
MEYLIMKLKSKLECVCRYAQELGFAFFTEFEKKLPKILKKFFLKLFF